MGPLQALGIPMAAEADEAIEEILAHVVRIVEINEQVNPSSLPA